MKRTSKRKKTNGAKAWPLGLGALYLMVNFPLVVFCKAGITGVGVGARARNIDREMPGVPLPVAFVITPFAYQIEQLLHWLCSPLQVRFYRGSGHTEWFFIIAALPVAIVISALWLAEIWAFDAMFGTRILPALFDLFLYFVSAFHSA